MVELNETFSVFLAGLAGTEVMIDTSFIATLTIIDDDGEAITLGVDSTEVVEGGGSVTVTATLNAVVPESFTVTVSTTDGTATAGGDSGSDYTAVDAMTLSFDGDAGEEETFTVTVLDDSIVEPSETFHVSLTGPTRTEAITFTITDNNDRAAVTLRPLIGIEAFVEETSNSVTPVEIVATLDHAVEGGFTVDVSTVEGTATAGVDYTEIIGESLVFAGTAGEEQIFTVEILDNRAVEPRETFEISLAEPDRFPASIDTSAILPVTILRHHQAVLILNGGNVDENTGQLTVRVTLESDVPIQGGYSFIPTIEDQTTIAGEDYTPLTGEILVVGENNPTQERTFTVEIIDDGIVEQDETFVVTIPPAMPDALQPLLRGSRGGVFTIIDNDQAMITLSAPETVEEGGGDGMVTVTATLNATIPGGFTVDVLTTADTPTSAADYSLPDTTLSFMGTVRETATFTVAITNDSTVEPNEMFSVSLTGLTGTEETIDISSTATVTIIDNDTATLELVVPDGPVSEESPGAGATITATLDNPVQGGFTVTVSTTSTVDDTATPGPGGDYTPITNRTLTFPDGSTEQIFAVEILDDLAVEREETFHVSLGGLAGTTVPVQLGPDAVVRITTDDFLSLTWADSEPAGEGMVAVVTATLDNRVEGGFTIPVRIGGGTATGDSDYTPTSGTLSFDGDAGETETFEVMIVDDTVSESRETFIVSLGDVVLTPALAPPPPDGPLNFFPRLEVVTVTIIDNDTLATGIALALDPVSVTEGTGGTITVPVRVTASFLPVDAIRVTETTVMVSVGADGDSATKGTDYTTMVDAFPITIPAIVTSGTASFDLVVIDDTLAERNETLTVSGMADLSVASATLTIVNSDPPMITLNAPETVEEGEGDGMVTVTATLNAAIPGGFRVDAVDASTTDDTATAATDYSLPDTTLNFMGTIGETATFTVAITDDRTVEPDETFSVSLTGLTGTGETIDISSTVTLTITDKDRATLRLVGPDGPVTEAFDARATITATLDNPVQGGFMVTVSTTSTVDDTATPGPGGDYTPITNMTLTFPDGITQQTFEVTLLDDPAVEREETFRVSLGGLAGTTLPVQFGPDAVVRIITDDFLSLTWAPSIPVGEGMVAVVTATLDNRVEGGFTIPVMIGGGTATGGSDYTPTSGTLSFDGDAGETETFEVMIVDDALLESEETFTVSLGDVVLTPASAPPPSDSSLNSFSRLETVTVTITDNDGPPTGIDLSLNPVSVTEGTGGMTTTAVRVTASFLPVGARLSTDTTVMVSVGAGGDSATRGTDYTRVDDFPITIPTTGTPGSDSFDLVVTGDALVEGNEILTVSGTAGLPVASETLTIRDNDTATVTLAGGTVREGDGTVMVSARLDAAVERSFTLQAVIGPGGTAAEGSDYAALEGRTLTFDGNPGEEQTFPVMILDDDVAEGLERLEITLTGMPGTVSEQILVQDTTVTIIDNDTARINLTTGESSVVESVGSVTFTATLLDAVQDSFTIQAVIGARGTAAEGSDYTVLIGERLTFDGNPEQEHTFTVAILDDNVVEEPETLEITLTSVPGSILAQILGSDVTITITDNDFARVTLELTENVPEATPGVAVTARLNVAVPGGFTVVASTADGTATAGSDSDYVAAEETLRFTGTAGEVQTFRVALWEDPVAEGDETFTVSLGDLTDTLARVDFSSPATVTIRDNDSATVTLEAAEDVPEGAGTVTVTARLDVAVQGGFTVEASTADGRATAGEDYTAVTDHMLTFAGTAGERRTFTVAVHDDGQREGNENFRVFLSGLDDTSATVDISSRATVRITESSDATVTLEVAERVAENAGTVMATARVDVAVEGGFSVRVQSTTGEATVNTDFTVPGSGRNILRFAGMAGEMHTFPVTILDDFEVEGDEGFRVWLQGIAFNRVPVMIDLVPASARITIADDDLATVTLRPPPGPVAEDAAV